MVEDDLESDHEEEQLMEFDDIVSEESDDTPVIEGSETSYS